MKILTYSLSLLMVGFCSFALAEHHTTHEQNKQGVQSQAATSQHRNELTSSAGKTVRVSELMNANIHNAKGDAIAEIHDLVLDPTSGDVRYVAVTYGGFLGLGDKLFAVPFDAINCRVNPEERDEHILSMNVTEKQLEGAKGFDQENWPNFADKNFTRELDQRYKVEREN